MANVLFIGFGLVLLFLILTLLKKNRQVSDYLLTLFFLLIAAELSFRTCIISGLGRDLHFMVFLDLVYWSLLGPVIYLYASFILKKQPSFKWPMIIHLLPLLIVMIPWITYCFDEYRAMDFFSYVNSGNIFFRIIIDFVWEYTTLFYNILVIVKIMNSRKVLLSYFSTIKNKDLSWLLYLTAGFSVYIVISMSIYYLRHFQVVPVSWNLSSLSNIILICYLLGIGIYGYLQEGIFVQHSFYEVSNLQFTGQISPKPEKELKYLRSGMSPEEAETLLKSLKLIMKSDRPFLDCEISIQDLSQKLNTSIHRLSQVINENFQMNFFDFINSYRIEEVKKLLQDSKNNHLKVISLAYDCGFNSKSAFYSSFKKNTGMTPSEYRKRYQPEHSKIFSN